MKLNIGKQIILVGAGLTVLTGIGAAGVGSAATSLKAATPVAIATPAPQAPAPSDEPTNDPTITLTAKDVVDYMEATNPKAVSTFCTAYFQVGDYYKALAIFKKGYGPIAAQMPGAPKASAVFDEVLTRC